MINCKMIFDIDGTICPIKKPNESYSDVVPYREIVNKIRELKKSGATIILFSSRNMKTYDNNLGLINKNTAPILIEWLKKWEIPYDEIYFGKPWPGDFGFYVDDRSIRPDEFLNNDLQQLEKICSQSRKNCR